MKIIFHPLENIDNHYVNIMIDLLKRKDRRIVGLKDYMRMGYKYGRRKDKEQEIAWLNWFENVSSFSIFIKKIITFILLRFKSIPIIWIMHNKQSHQNNFLSQILFYLMVKYSKIIIIHSHISEEYLKKYNVKVKNKIYYIPLPNYIGDYGPISKKEIDKKKLKLLFLGAIKPYKNIELLINIVSDFNDKVQLIIAGKPYSKKYKEKLEKMNKYENIHFISEYIPNNKISSYLSDTDLLVLPYNLKSSLNSGAAILSFSYKKTIICPEIGTLLDMKNKNFLSYIYKNKKEHYNNLRNVISNAIKLKSEDENIFKNWGEIMFNEVGKENSKEKISEMIDELFIHL